MKKSKAEKRSESHARKRPKALSFTSIIQSREWRSIEPIGNDA